MVLGLDGQQNQEMGTMPDVHGNYADINYVHEGKMLRLQLREQLHTAAPLLFASSTAAPGNFSICFQLQLLTGIRPWHKLSFAWYNFAWYNLY